MKNEKTKRIFGGKAARSAVVICAVLLIGLAVYLNYRWFYDPIDSMGIGNGNMENNYDDSLETGADGEENDYFTTVALSRRQSRDEAIDLLTIAIESESTDEATRADAEARIARIATDIQNEANIETLVKAKGFEECLALIGEDTVSVVVKADELQGKQTAQILSIVYETTGIAPEKVTIINK
jgi:stage III sporulation protein AH